MEFGYLHDLPRPLVLMIGAVLGGCLGSFANVLIYRLPRNLSVVGPRSFCPGCRRQIRWWENIPLVSWLMLRGQCRGCGVAIGLRYPLVELAGCLSGLLAGIAFGLSWSGLAALLFLIILLAIATIDWEHMIIPHTLTLAGMALGLLLAPGRGIGLGEALLGGAAGAGIILALSYGYRLVRGQLGMGGGDVMLMGMVGIFLGLSGVVIVLLGGALLGSLFAVVRYRGRLTGEAKLPFGTFLALAAGLALWWGDPLVNWYLDLLV